MGIGRCGRIVVGANDVGGGGGADAGDSGFYKALGLLGFADAAGDFDFELVSDCFFDEFDVV